MSEPLVIGIDPGKSGAVVALRGSDVLYAAPVPMLSGKGKRYDVAGMAAALGAATRPNTRLDVPTPMFVVLEHAVAGAVRRRPNGTPIVSTTSLIETGRGWGLWEGIIASRRLPYEMPRPTVWTKAMGCPGKDKTLRFEVCGRLLPALDLVHGTVVSRRRVKHDGIADAALLAVWGQRRLRGM